jgi:hypothetical protein
VVQMVLFKELRALLTRKNPARDTSSLALLSGAITNEVFGSLNREKVFQDFRQQNRAEIEQELLGLAQQLPALGAPLTDALRVQVLCDEMEGKDSAHLLLQATEIGLLIKERDIPLPTTFMAMTRALGDTYRLITAPVEIPPDDAGSPVQ